MPIVNPTDDRPLGDAEPVLFLAGPIQGAPDFQTEFAQAVVAKRPDFVVATPRVPADLDRATFDYGRQVDWEERHLWRAARRGGIAFWFAAQDPALPYPAGRAYAQTSRIEIGMVVGWRRFMALNLAVGFDPAYGGGSERYIRHLLHREGVPVAGDRDEFVDHLDRHILSRVTGPAASP